GLFVGHFAPLVGGNLDAPLDNVALPEGRDDKRMDRRLQHREAFNKESAKGTRRDALQAHDQFVMEAVRFRNRPALRGIDSAAEKPEVMKRYGAEGDTGVFGKACVMARRLVESGVRFVEVTLDGWDTHADNFNQVKTLLGQLDPAFSALVSDL